MHMPRYAAFMLLVALFIAAKRFQRRIAEREIVCDNWSPITPRQTESGFAKQRDRPSVRVALVLDDADSIY